MRSVAIALAAALLLAGCSSTEVQWHPQYVTRTYYVTTARALVFAEGDAPILQQAGGELIGQIEGSGNRYASQGDVAEHASESAARHGGTHIIAVGHGATHSTNYVWNQYGAYAVDSSSPNARFLVIRVDPTRWAELPEVLRPLPLTPSSAGAPSSSAQASTP